MIRQPDGEQDDFGNPTPPSSPLEQALTLVMQIEARGYRVLVERISFLSHAVLTGAEPAAPDLFTVTCRLQGAVGTAFAPSTDADLVSALTQALTMVSLHA